MIFFVALPMVIGLMNLVVPLQIGARDVAFPFLNNLSFWLFAVAAILVNISLVVGEFAKTGWLAYAPLSGIEFSPGVGVDYWIWALQISGIGTTLTGINFFVTIIKMRTKGMTMFRMPIFTWTSLCANVLIIASFPILTATIALLTLDHYFGMHFFTMGAGANVNAFFGIMTMIIAIPTGVKVFNWLFTIYRGSLELTSPVLWTLGFIITFTLGGMTGVMLAVPAANFVLHNSLFVIAHFHNVIIGGVVFGMMAGLTFWFPKAFGFTLDEKWGKRSFWCWFIGFYVAFMPLYVLSFFGAVRRMQSYANPEWQPWMILAWVGAVIIMMGITCTIIQFWVSIRDRKQNADVTGDPWDGRTLEWSTSSPAPFYNFARLPEVGDIDSFWSQKKRGNEQLEEAPYTDIHMPRNTVAGPVMSLFALVIGFALVWHIWWLAAVGALGVFVSFMAWVFNDDIDYYVPAADVERIERAHQQRVDDINSNVSVTLRYLRRADERHGGRPNRRRYLRTPLCIGRNLPAVVQ
jgi:cytochrome o ubiquinol oxidase subunit 1